MIYMNKLNVLLITALTAVLLSCSDNSKNQNEEEPKLIESVNAQIESPEDSTSKQDLPKPNLIKEKTDTIISTFIHADDNKFTIKVMEFSTGDIRYHCWNKPNEITNEPNLILKNGNRDFFGSQGGQGFTFLNDPYKYEIRHVLMAETDDRVGIFLSVYKNDTIILKSKLLEVENLTAQNYTVHNTQKLKTILSFCNMSWDSLYSSSDIRKGYVDNVGIRGRYGMLNNTLGISVLELLFEEDVFISGPHKNGMNYESDTLGRYNPKFIAKISKELQEVFKDKEFIKSTQNLYDKQLKNYLRTYYISYPIAANQSKYIYNYEQEAFREFAEGIEKEGYNIYEGFTCPGFWVRRSIDGTSNDFFRLLKLVMSSYDNDFLLNNRIEEIKRPDIFDDYVQPVADYEGCSY